MFSTSKSLFLSALGLSLIAGCTGESNKSSEGVAQPAATAAATALCNTEGFNPFGTKRKSLSSADRLKALRLLKTQYDGWERLSELLVVPDGPSNVHSDPFITLIQAGLASGKCRGVRKSEGSRSEISVTGALCPIEYIVVSDPITSSESGQRIVEKVVASIVYADRSQARDFVSRKLEGDGKQVNRYHENSEDNTYCHTLKGRMETVALGPVEMFSAHASQQHRIAEVARVSETRGDFVLRRGYRLGEGVAEIRLTEQARGEQRSFQLSINGEEVPLAESSTIGTLAEISEMMKRD